MHHSWKRLISGLLVLVLVVSIIPVGIPLPAQASDINDMDALAALGIDTSVIPEDYDPNSTDNPYGKNNVTVQEVSELFTAEHNSYTRDNHVYYSPDTQLHGHNQALGQTMSTLESRDVLSDSKGDLYSKQRGPSIYYPAAISVAGNFDGNTEGRQSQVVTLGVDSLSAQTPLTGLSFYITDLKIENGSPRYAYSQEEKYLISSKFIDSEDNDSSSMFAIDGSGGSDNFRLDEEPYLAQNYLKAVTGDFDGNGIDEIAVYVPNPNKSRIEIYRLETTGAAGEYLDMDNWKIAYSYYLEDQYEGNPRYNAPSANMVSLVTDDFNQDGTDDLAIAWGYYSCKGSQPSVWNKETRAVLLYGNDDKNLIMEEQELPAVYDGIPLYRTSLVQGDLNNDGSKELLMSGQLLSDISSGNIYSRAVMIYNYNGSEFELGEKYNFQIIEDKNDNGNFADEDGFPYYSSPSNVINLAVGRFEGLASPVNLYMDSVIYQYGNDGLKAVARLDNHPSWNPNKQFYTESGAVSADYLGVGREAIYTQQFYFAEQIQNIHHWFLPSGIFPNKNAAGAVRCLYRENSDFRITQKRYMEGPNEKLLNFSFCPVNTDKDTAFMRYTGERYLTYADPKVLAVVASPPYFQDLSGDHLSGRYMDSFTSYTDMVGEGSESSAVATLTLGAYVSFEQEFSILGVKIAQSEASVEMTANFTYEFSKTKSLSQSVTYGTTAGMDVVAFYSVPLEVYVYDSVTPELDAYGNVVSYTNQKMSVNIPHKARVVSMDLRKYEAIARDYPDLPQISGSALTHTLGDPASYPASAKGFNNALVYPGDPAGVDYGETGWVSQTLDVTEEVSHGFVITQQVQGKVGMGAAGITMGVIAGEEAGGGRAWISTEGSSYTGQLSNMPPEAEGYGYDYVWRMFTYVQKDKQGDYPVVSYLVEECTAPPMLPGDFVQDMSATTDTSIDLTWSYTGGVSAFKIYRYYEFPEGAGNYEVASVSGLAPDYVSYDADGTRRTHYRFTDKNLQPYTEYQYVIQTVGTGVPTYSIPSKTLTARTKTAEGYPDLRISFPRDSRPEDVARNVLKVYPDRNATVGVIAENSDRYPQGFTYQWQKFNRDSNNWEDISAATYSAYTFRNTGVSDAGAYRCRVNTVYQGDTQYYITTYTDVFTVEYSLRTAELYDFSVTGGSTAGGEISPVHLKASVRSGHTNHSTVPMRIISFQVESPNYSAIHHAEVREDGSVSLDVSLPQGYYTVTPLYPGNRVFKSATLEPVSILVGNSGYQMEYEDVNGKEINRSDIHFGDQFYYRLYHYEKMPDGSLQKTLVDMNNLAILIQYQDGFINHNYRSLSSGSGEIDSVFPVDGQTPVNVFSSGPNQVFLRLYLDENHEIIPIVSDGKNFEPERTPAVTLEWNEDFYAKPRPVSIRFREDAYTCESGEYSIQLPTLSDLVITGLGKGTWSKYPYDFHEDIFANDPSLDGRQNLRLVMNVYTNAGVKIPNFDSDDTIPGKYQLRVEPGPDTAESILRNYEFTFHPGVFYVTGALHPITLSSRFEGTAQGIGTPGTVTILSPYSAISRGRCSVGTDLVFSAQPFAGYELKDWEVNGVSQKTNSSVFTHTMLAESTQITAVFRLKRNTLQFYASPAYAGTVTERSMSTSGIVASGYPLTFTAVPEKGYAFREWQVVRAGISTVYDGTPGADGSSVLNTVMSESNVTVIGLFERESYQLTLSGGLQARFLDDVDGLANTPDEEVTVGSGARIPGDREVTVSAKPGFRIPQGAVWVVNGQELPASQQDSLTFVMDRDMSVSIRTENRNSSLQIDIRGPGLTQHQVVASIDGQILSSPDQFRNIPGGTAVSLEATAGYGFRFQKWQINGEDAGINRILTIPALDGDTVVTAVFDANTLHHITVEPNVGYGTLSYTIPAGNISGTVDSEGGSIPVYEGADIAFTAQPALLKMVDYWVVDGDKTYTADTEQAFANVTADHTLAVGFKDMVYFDVTFALENGAPGQYLQMQVNDDQIYSAGTIEAIAGGSSLKFSILGPTDTIMVRRWVCTMPDGSEKVLMKDGWPLVESDLTTVLSGQLNLTAQMEPLSFREVQITGEHFTLQDAQFTPELRAWEQLNQLLVRKGGRAVLTIVPEEGFAIVGAESTDFLDDSVTILADGSCVCTIPCVQYTDAPIAISVRTVEKKQTHLVSFDTTGGSPVEPVLVEQGSCLTPPADPVKKDMVFAGWYVDPMLTVAYDFESPVVRDMTLYAQWKPKTPYENPFVDIDGHWGYSAILYCTERGLFVGVTDTEFAPEREMTRAMLVTVLHRLEGSPQATADHPFTDVPESEWYAEPIRWAYEQGIVLGVSDTEFAPEEVITREQFCVMIAKYAMGKTPDQVIDTEGLKLFDDYDQVSPWAIPGMNYCYTVGLLKGDPDNMLHPADGTTRAEGAAILMRYLMMVP